MLIVLPGARIYAVHFTHGVVEYLRWRCSCGTRSGLLSVEVPCLEPGDFAHGRKTVAVYEFDAMWQSHVDAAIAEDPESSHMDSLWDRLTRRATWATVHRGRCEAVRPCAHPERVTARVECGASDRFEKAKGRKLALGRALIAAKFPKEERSLIWQGYRGLGSGSFPWSR